MKWFLTWFLIVIPYLAFGAVTSVTDKSDYLSICRAAATDDDLFANFKQQPVYRDVLEHVSQNLGFAYLTILKNRYPNIYSRIESLKENDRDGHPQVFDYPEIGKISPTTLRYAKIAGDLLQYFGDLRNKTIVEIGGGYGGQILILNLLSKSSYYHIFDLPEVLALQKKYLNKHNIDCIFYHDGRNIESIGQYDLLISNYAFSECSKEIQLMYLDKVISFAQAGYMIMNRFRTDNLTSSQVISLLQRQGFRVQKLQEDPSSFNGNYLLVFRKNKSIL